MSAWILRGFAAERPDCIARWACLVPRRMRDPHSGAVLLLFRGLRTAATRQAMLGLCVTQRVLKR